MTQSPRNTSGRPEIVADPNRLATQAELQALLLEPRLISKTQGQVDGRLVTLNPQTGEITCNCDWFPNCWHIDQFHARRIR